MMCDAVLVCKHVVKCCVNAPNMLKDVLLVRQCVVRCCKCDIVLCDVVNATACCVMLC